MGAVRIMLQTHGSRGTEEGGGRGRRDLNITTPPTETGRKIVGSRQRPADTADADPTCRLCPRTFSSMKALYGHMRCHVKRTQTGIIPPPDHQEPESAARPPSPPPQPKRKHDKQGAAANRSKRSKREYTGISACSAQEMILMCRAALSCADCLTRSKREIVRDHEHADDISACSVREIIILCRAALNCDNCSKRSRSEVHDHEFADISARSGEEAIVLCGGAVNLLYLGREKLQNPEPQGTTSSDEDISDDPAEERGKKMAASMDDAAGMEHDEAAEAVMAVDEGTDEVEQHNSVPKEYPCTACHRSFSSHQALGGHIAAHKEHKNSNKDQQQEQQIQSAPASECMHRCDQCPMAFETGQALGGHKRKHYVKKTEQENATEPVLNVAAQQPEHDLDDEDN